MDIPLNDANTMSAQPVEFMPLDMVRTTVPIQRLEQLLPVLGESHHPYTLQWLGWKASPPSIVHKAGRGLTLFWRQQDETLLDAACSRRLAIQRELWLIEKWAQMWTSPTPWSTRRRTMHIEEGQPIEWPVITSLTKHEEQTNYFTGAKEWSSREVQRYHSTFYFSVFTIHNELII